MLEYIKKTVILITLLLTLTYLVIDISYGIYFGVLTNCLINVFWTANLFCKVPGSKKTKGEFGFRATKDDVLLTEQVDIRKGPPRL